MADNNIADNNIGTFLSLVYFEFVEEGELFTKLDSLRDAGFDFHKIDRTYAIHFASFEGNLPVVNYLILHQHANDILLCDFDGYSALHMAASGGHTKVFNALLEALQGTGREYYINTTRNKVTGALPIHYAVGKSQINMAQYLLDKGADINSTDSSGATPFHFAARCGSIEALEFVLERQCGDVNHSNRAGLTALHYAAWNGKLNAIQWLLKKGATVESCDKVEGATPLHWAAMGGKMEALEMLVRAKPQAVFLRNKRCQNVLEVAEEYEQASGIAKKVLVKHLLDTLMDIRHLEAIPQKYLAMCVIRYGDGQTIKELRTDLARPWNRGILQELVQDTDGSGIVEWAARTGNEESIDLVLELLCQYTEPEVLKKKVSAGLHRALLHGKIEFVKALADHKDCKGKISMVHVLKGLRKFLVDEDFIASLSAKDLKLFYKRYSVSLVVRKEIPLAFWLFHGNREEIVTFISDQGLWGVLVNEKGPYTGRTALHWAAILKKHDIVKRLCEIKECQTNPNDFVGNYPHAYAVTEEIQMELTAHEDVQTYLFGERQVFVDALNAILVGAALIAAISFQGFLQPPRGYSGRYMYVGGQSIKSFIRFNSMSFFFAMASALSAARGVLPTKDIYVHDALKGIKRTLVASATYLSLSIGCALFAFGAAGHSVIPQALEKQSGFNVVLGVGGAMSVLMLLWFLMGLLGLINYSPFGKFMMSDAVDRTSERDAVDGTSECDEGSKVQLKRSGYDVGRNYPQVPWDDGLDKLSSSLPAGQTSPDPDAARPSPAAPI